MRNFVNALIIAILAAIAFGVNWMGYEQMRANRGIFLDPAAMSAPEPPNPWKQPMPREHSTPREF